MSKFYHRASLIKSCILDEKKQAKKIGNGLNIVVLPDDSASISEADWKAQTRATAELLGNLDDKSPTNQFALATFHSTSTVVCQWTTYNTETNTSASESIIDALTRYTRKKGSTNLISGMETASTLFDELTTTNDGNAANDQQPNRNLVFVLTDGHANSEPTSAAFRLKMRHNATVFGIGVGNFGMEQIEAFSTRGRAFSAATFDDLIASLTGSDEEVLDAMERGGGAASSSAASAPHPYEIQVIATICNVPLTLLDDLELELDIDNVGSETIPEQSMLSLNRDNKFYFRKSIHFQTPLAPGESCTFKTVLKNHRDVATSHISTLPESIDFELTLPGSHQCVHCVDQAIALHSHYFIGEFLNRPLPYGLKCRRVLLFGIVGVGKSALLATLCTQYSDRPTTPAVVGGTSDHVTLKLRHYDVAAHWCGDADIAPVLSLIDLWGLDENNFGPGMLEAVLQGFVPEGFEMPAESMDNSPASMQFIADAARGKIDPTAIAARRAHAVILVVSISVALDDVILERIKAMNKVMAQLGHSPVVVMTHLNTVDDETELVNMFLDRTAIPRQRVHTITNYCALPSDSGKCWDVDHRAMAILDAAIEQADQFCYNELNMARGSSSSSGGSGGDNAQSSTATEPIVIDKLSVLLNDGKRHGSLRKVSSNATLASIRLEIDTLVDAMPWSPSPSATFSFVDPSTGNPIDLSSERDTTVSTAIENKAITLSAPPTPTAAKVSIVCADDRRQSHGSLRGVDVSRTSVAMARKLINAELDNVPDDAAWRFVDSDGDPVGIRQEGSMMLADIMAANQTILVTF